MNRSRGDTPNLRQLRVGEELRHALVRVLGHGDLADPDLVDVAITVTEVKVSPDLKNATAFVTPLGGANLKTTVAALNRAAAFLRGRMGRELALRHTPRIGFAADHSFDHAAKMQDILNKPRVRQDLETPPSDPLKSEGSAAGEERDDG